MVPLPFILNKSSSAPLVLELRHSRQNQAPRAILSPLRFLQRINPTKSSKLLQFLRHRSTLQFQLSVPVMKGGTVQINWHETKPVLTLDFHPSTGLLATGGADFDIKLWLLVCEAEKKVPEASYQNSLSYHSSAVNALRFSPSGELLASGADGGEMIIWKLHTSETGQTWKVFKTLSFHRKDVLDLQWSKDDTFLVSGSVDNSCIIWDINKGSVHQILDAHAHYVQGVAWDPLSKYVASLSSDRTCRIYVRKPQTKSKVGEKANYACLHIISKAEQQSSDDSRSAKNHLFHDETLPSFFRRLAWAPDGSFLLVPAGSCKLSPSSEPVNTAYVFSRKDLSRPVLQLPGASKPIVAVRFCPVLFKLRGSNPSGGSPFKLPYRIVFAVATLNSLYIYDTESIPPVAILAGLHYAAITDIAWSTGAHFLAVSSQDGYCTLLEFENDELGSPFSVPSPAEEKKATNGEEEVRPDSKPESMLIEQAMIPCVPVLNLDLGSAAKPEPEQTGKELEAASGSVGSSSAVPNKPAKRRITPMAID